MIKTNRKEWWQLVALGVGFFIAAIVWLVVSIALTPHATPDTHALISILPFAILILAGCSFIGTSLGTWISSIFGLRRWEDEE